MAVVITIRGAVAEDIEAMARLEAANQPKPWSIGVFKDELAGDNRVYLVAEDSEVIGFAGAMVVGDEAHVTNLLVDPELRRHGIARQMMSELRKAVVEMGARHLTLEVRSKNEAARALYASLGLAPVGVRKDYYGDDDALILWAHDVDEEFKQ